MREVEYLAVLSTVDCGMGCRIHPAPKGAGILLAFYKYRRVSSETMGVRRTAVVKLAVSDEQRDALHRTAEQYLYCAN